MCVTSCPGYMRGVCTAAVQADCGSPHGEGTLAFPGGTGSQVDDVIMGLLQPVSKGGVVVVLVTEHGKVHGVVPV